MFHDLERSQTVSRPESISLSRFEAQLDFLRRSGWSTLQFEDLRRACRGQEPWPERSVWLTFDDGYSSFVELALPALRARNMTGTLFVVAGYVGGFNGWDGARRERRRLLSHGELAEMAAAGIEIGSHGWSHLDLRHCSPGELTREIVASRLELEARTQSHVSLFSYPYGGHRREFFGQVAAAGYDAAVAVRASGWSLSPNRFAMRRIAVQQQDTPARLRLKLSSIYLRYRACRDTVQICCGSSRS